MGSSYGRLVFLIFGDLNIHCILLSLVRMQRKHLMSRYIL
jgi:hypothetical protein